MKKTNKNIYKLSVLFVFIFLFSFVFNTVNAATLWTYTENTTIPGVVRSGYTTIDLCNIDRNSYITSHPYLSAASAPSPCVSYVSTPPVITPPSTPPPPVITPPSTPPINVGSMNIVKNSTLYKMLAPLPGITCMDWSGTDQTCIGNDIGKYLNILFKLGIGISIFLAVVMIIINGIKYMGDESVFGKTGAKEGIFSAILGLLIALCAWALLNTINPYLTGAGGVTVSAATIQLDPLIHGDNPQTPQAGGKVCGTPGKYTVGDAWADDSSIRSSITSAGITINRNNCKNVGEQNCTSVTGLNASGLIALKNKCNGCSLMITGATECWLHSTNTSHLPGGSTVDLSFTSAGLTSYIETGITPVQSNMGFPVYTKNGTKFMKEKDHYHIISW